MTRKILPFSWYGGKYSKLGWLLPLLPKTTHFIDVFGGSASVLLNRERSPIETYNDLNGDVCRFFRVCRDRGDELIEKINLTPYAKEEFVLSLTKDTDDELELARRFFVKLNMSYASMEKCKAYDFKRVTKNKKDDMAGGMSAYVNKFNTKKKMMKRICERFLSVQIENEDAIKLMKRYDHKDTLFYCDPPYLASTRVKGKTNKYSFEMNEEKYKEFAEIANACEARVAISGYDHEFFNALFPQDKWKKIFDKEKILIVDRNTRSKEFRKRTEMLMVNY